MTTATQTLAEFLLARIAEDESYAQEAWIGGRFDERRVLAECEAKRRIVQTTVDYSPELEHGDNGSWALDTVLRLLALPYADHPDFRPEWRL